MSRKKRAIPFAVAGAALLCLAAYVSASYLLSPAIVDSGGGHADSSGYQLDCSIGGPVIVPTAAGGEATSASYGLQANVVGMLAEPPAPPPPPPAGDGGGGCAPGAGGVAALAPLALALLLASLRCRRRS